MALYFLQGSKELMTNTNLLLTLRSKLKHRETKYTRVRGWDTKIDAPDPICTAFTPRHALSLHKEHTLKVGWQRLWKRKEQDWLEKGWEDLLQGWSIAEQMMPSSKDFSDRERVCILLVMPKRRGGHLPGWCSVAQRLCIYNTFYILIPLRS